jgi:DNA-binding MarR family transcriptional regulator
MSQSADPRSSLEDAIQVLVRVGRILDQTPTPLPLAHYRVLALVASGERRASRLASRLPVAKPTITSAVDALATAGLLVRRRDDIDGRVVSLSVTESGRMVLHATTEALVEKLQPFFAAVSDPKALIHLLVEVGEAIDSRHQQGATPAGVRA